MFPYFTHYLHPHILGYLFMGTGAHVTEVGVLEGVPGKLHRIPVAGYEVPVQVGIRLIL